MDFNKKYILWGLGVLIVLFVLNLLYKKFVEKEVIEGKKSPSRQQIGGGASSCTFLDSNDFWKKKEAIYLDVWWNYPQYKKDAIYNEYETGGSTEDAFWNYAYDKMLLDGYCGGV